MQKGKFLNIREGQLIHLVVMMELENIHLIIVMQFRAKSLMKLKLLRGSLRNKVSKYIFMRYLFITNGKE